MLFVSGVGAQDRIAIHGRVTDWFGRPLPNATVRVADPSGKVLAESATADDGGYRLEATTATPLRLTLSLSGFVSAAMTLSDFRNGEVVWNQGLRFGTENEAEFTLRGRVVSADGRAVGGALVSVRSALSDDLWIQAISDRHGAFRVTGMPNGGRYVVSAVDEHMGIGVAGVTLDGSVSTTADVIVTFSPGQNQAGR